MVPWVIGPPSWSSGFPNKITHYSLPQQLVSLGLLACHGMSSMRLDSVTCWPQNYVSSLERVMSLSHVQLCNPMDCSLSGSSVHGIFQARILEWIAISFTRGSSWPRNRTQVSSIVGRCFTVWDTSEALLNHKSMPKIKTSSFTNFDWGSYLKLLFTFFIHCVLIFYDLYLTI